MRCRNQLPKALGAAILAFGAGVTLAFFLPLCVLATAEAIVLVLGGLLVLWKI